MEITNVFTLGVNFPLFPRSSLPSLPSFSMLETNKHPRSVLQHCFFFWGGGGGKGVATDEKSCSIQIQMARYDSILRFAGSFEGYLTSTKSFLFRFERTFG